jgi:NAD(P)-dependent dehydrogenase (short-subunit alcohol dehydrogenase family)
VTGVQSDVSKMADLDKLYAAVKEQKGKLDIVFAGAGTGAFAPLGQISEEHFDKQFDVNVRGLLFTVQKALPLLQPGGSNRTECIDSFHHRQSGLQRLQRDQGRGPLVCAHLVRRPQGAQVRVNAISPGLIPTPGYNTSLGMTQEQVDQFVPSSIDNIPLGRPGTADEIAKAVLFLASDDASYITGIELFVDGGWAQI